MSLFKNLNINHLVNSKNIYFFLFISSLISRLIISYFYGDRNLVNEWETLVTNLYNNGALYMLEFDGVIVPNLWMPPIYAYFVYLHALVFGLEENLANYVVASQILISSLSTIIFYKIIKKFFSSRLSLIGALIFSFFPIIAYSASQISSVTIYLFLFLLFNLYILNLAESKSHRKYKHYILIGLIAGVLILTRRDFILIYFFSLFYIFFIFKTPIKKIFLILLLTSITISPYIVRNYVSFDKFIVHTGFGYNLWKAYNLNAKVEGNYIHSAKLLSKLETVEKDIYYRINADKIYFEETKDIILENPKRSVEFYFKRLFSLFFLDLNSSQDNYFNFFHIFPNILISILSFFGLIICSKKNYSLNYLIMNMIIILCVYSLFALMPRYKIYILPFQIILSLTFIKFVKNKLIKKY